jgi:hypothetical protein
VRFRNGCESVRRTGTATAERHALAVDSARWSSSRNSLCKRVQSDLPAVRRPDCIARRFPSLAMAIEVMLELYTGTVRSC